VGVVGCELPIGFGADQIASIHLRHDSGVKIRGKKSIQNVSRFQRRGQFVKNSLVILVTTPLCSNKQKWR
jgi:hypothetical protein